MAPRLMVAIGWLAWCSACAQHPAATPFVRPCGPVGTFADSTQPLSIVHVATSGNDDTGDGSATNAFSTIARAAQRAAPGTAIYIHAGTYEGRAFLTDLHGNATAPIWIMGAPGEARPVIRGGREGLHLVQPRFVVVRDLEIRDIDDNGINVDDGEAVGDSEAARFVAFENLDVHDTGQRPSGIADCLKMAGVSDVAVLHSRFARCGGGASSGAVGVGGVGVHQATISFNRFEETGFGGVQFKGGSSEVEISGNVFVNAGTRAVNMGGSTGESFFRPPLRTADLNYEAARIRVVANQVVGGEAAAAFTGCVDCQFVNNTVADPSKWAIRILQEAVSNDRFRFAPASRGLIADNIFYFRRSDLSTGEDINVGSGTDSSTFSLVRNVWFAHDQPDESKPRLPSFAGSQHRSMVGTDPDFVDAEARDFRLRPVSAARAAGSAEFVSGNDRSGACFANPPSLGAYQFKE